MKLYTEDKEVDYNFGDVFLLDPKKAYMINSKGEIPNKVIIREEGIIDFETGDIVVKFDKNSMVDPYKGISLISRLIKIPSSIEIL